MDRQDIANFRKYIESGTQAELAKYVRRKLKPNSPLRKNPAFDNMIAGSPDFIDDLDSMSEYMWSDEVERADREMRRSNAQMTMFKNKIKKPKKQQKSIKLGQTQLSIMSHGPISVAMSNLSSSITRYITKQIGIEVFSTIELLTHRYLSAFTEVRLETIPIPPSSMDTDTDTALTLVVGFP